MIDIAYYNDAIHVLYNDQDYNDISDLDIEEGTTFRIYTKENIFQPIMYWDDTTAEDEDGEEYEYEYVVLNKIKQFCKHNKEPFEIVGGRLKLNDY